MAVREKTIEVHIYGCENVETKREREKKIEKKTKGRRERRKRYESTLEDLWLPKWPNCREEEREKKRGRKR